jgi:hypothetical protein
MPRPRLLGEQMRRVMASANAAAAGTISCPALVVLDRP